MSAAAGAGASTGAVPSAEAIASRERFIQGDTVNPICFGAVHTIAESLKRKANIRFFVKGGAAATLLLTGNPRGIVNDIDCAVLVNPTLKEDRFEETRILAVRECIYRLVLSLNQPNKSIHNYIRDQCIHYGLAPLSLPPPLRVGRAAPDGEALKTGIESFITEKGLALKPECPLFIDVWPSLIFQGESLQMAVITLRTHTEPSLSLVDIAIPAQSYLHLPYEWENYTVDPFTVYKRKIPILSPSAQIYNQERAEALTIRGSTAIFNAKANRRRARTAALRARFSAAPAASVAPAAALNAIAAAAIAAGAAGGAGAAAPAASLFSAPLPASSGTRRNNRTRRNNSRASINYRTLPLGKPLNFVRKPPQGYSKELLNTGRVIPVLNTEGRILQLRNLPSRYLGAHHGLYRDLRPESSQFIVLDREGYFHPLGKDLVRDPTTGQWGVKGYDGSIYFLK